jgi:hypothetical protein
MFFILAIVSIALVAFGVFLIFTREWSAGFHERWNQKSSWTRWATGPKTMRASRVANVVVGIALIAVGLVLGLVAIYVAWLPAVISANP